MNRTGEMRNFYCTEGFSLLSASNTNKAIDIFPFFLKINESEFKFYLFSFSKTNTTVTLLQLVYMVYNQEYFNQKGVSNFSKYEFGLFE